MSGLQKPIYAQLLKDDGKHGVLTRARKEANAADLNSPYNIKKHQAARSLKDKENDASAANAQPRVSASPLSAKDSGKKAKFANQDMNRQGLSVGTQANCETRPAGGSMEDQNPDLYSLSHLELTKCRMCHEFFHKPCAFSAHTRNAVFIK